MREMLTYFFLVSLVCGLLILLATGITRLLRNRIGRKWRYVFWIVLAVRMLLPFDISISNPVLTIELPQSVEAEGPQTPAQTSVPEHTGTDSIEIPETGGNSPVRDEEPSQGHVDNPVEAPATATGFDWNLVWQMIPWIWLGGMGITAVWFLGSYLYQRRYLLRWSYAPLGQEIRRYFDEYRDLLGVTHRVQIRVCKRITSPMMLGLIDPILVIPEGRYTAKELEYIFRHELSHLKRHDVWVKSLMLLVRVVHWFNPATALMYREMSDDIEILCDSQVVQDMEAAQRKEYSEVLLKYMVRKQEEKMEFSTCFGSRIERMKDRFVQVVRGNRLHKAYGICAVLLLGLAAASLLTTLSRGSGTSIPEEKPIGQQAEESVGEDSVSEDPQVTADGLLAQTYLSVVEDLWPDEVTGTVRLLDFSMDGVPELLCAGSRENTAWLRIYQYRDGQPELLWEEEASLSGTEEDPKIWLIHQDDRYMLRWASVTPELQGDFWEFHNGRMESIWQYDETGREEGTAQINGGVLSLEEYCVQMNHMLEGAREQVIDFQTPEPSMQSLTADTLEALRAGASEGRLILPSDEACWSSVEPYVYDENEAQLRSVRQMAQDYLSIIQSLEQTYNQMGICRLLDFDGDGTVELYCTFREGNREFEWGVNWEQIYGYTEDGLVRIWDSRMARDSGDYGTTTIFLQKDNRVYLRWSPDYIGDRGYYYALEDGQMVPVVQYDYGRQGGTRSSYNGVEMSSNELRQQLNDWEVGGWVQEMDAGAQISEQRIEALKNALQEAADTGVLTTSDWDGAWSEAEPREIVEIPFEPVADSPERTAYREVLTELQMSYGVATQVYSMFQGLCMAKLVDFDGDGVMEFYCAYSQVDESIEYTGAYREEIYQYQDGQAVQIYTGRVLNIGTSVQPSVRILHKDGRAYLLCGGEQDYAYRALIDGQMRDVFSYHIGIGGEEPYEVNGQQVTDEEYRAAWNEFVAGGTVEAYTFYTTPANEGEQLVSVEDI